MPAQQGPPVHHSTMQLLFSLSWRNLTGHQELGGAQGPAYAMAHAPLSRQPVNPPHEHTNVPSLRPYDMA